MDNNYIYIMTNDTNTTLYIGVTNDIVRRVGEHKNELVDGFTKKYRLHKLVYVEVISSIKVAIEREKQLKKWNRQKKILLIESINPSWEDLSLSL